MRANPNIILSHWNQMVPGLQQSAQEFYASIEAMLSPHGLKDVKVERVTFAEGGLLSAKREYLQIRRSSHVFHVCAAPYGSGFSVSSWLGQIDSGILAWLSTLPLVGWIFERFIKPLTYYKVDTATMFQLVAHGAVLAALDSVTQAKGLRALTELERKPVMRDFFAQISG